ncbi:MAG: sulfite exporter TauE/SafE family protein, partial [bacterium]
REHWLDLGIGIVFLLVSTRMVAESVRRFPRRRPAETNDETIGGTLTQKVATGAIAGVLPGLLGIGTGVILVPAFNLLLHAPIKIAMACSLTCFSFNALISSAFKLAQGFVDLSVALPICFGTLIGANLGAILNKRFASDVVRLLFGLLFMYISMRFIVSFFVR